MAGTERLHNRREAVHLLRNREPRQRRTMWLATGDGHPCRAVERPGWRTMGASLADHCRAVTASALESRERKMPTTREARLSCGT